MQHTNIQSARAAKIARLFTVTCGLAALSTFAPKLALADVLEQKWQAGQQLSYDFKMNGTMRFTAPGQVPMIGGLPLEVLLNGEGQSSLDTREIDEFGVAVVAPRMERLQLKFNETNFNQKGVLGYREGKANLSLNGQNVAPNMDWSKAANPDYGLRITKSLRILGAQPLTDKAAANEKPEATEETKPASKNPLPFDFPAMMQAMITRSIPPLLPDRDVKIGDTWRAEIQMPVLPGKKAPVGKQVAPGEFNFKALSEEEIAGRKTWRIAVDGALKISDLSTQAANDTLEKRGTANNVKLPKFLTLAQSMKGDVWFDVAAGQVVRVDMRLNSSAEGRNETGKASDGDMNFSGTVQMDLRKISFSGGQ